MQEKIECTRPIGAGCNGCPVVDIAKAASDREPKRPVAEILVEVADNHCPEGRGPEWTETTPAEPRRI